MEQVQDLLVAALTGFISGLLLCIPVGPVNLTIMNENQPKIGCPFFKLYLKMNISDLNFALIECRKKALVRSKIKQMLSLL